MAPESFLGGRLKVLQSRDGYRFSIDALVLAHHAVPHANDQRAADLGCGCGIIPLVLALRHPHVQIFGVEIQPRLVDLAARNVRLNGFEARVTILEADLQSLSPQALGGAVDMLVSNPPYRRSASGRVNPHAERAIARHEIAMTLTGLIAAARRLLRTGGRLWLIYPAERLAELMAGLHRGGLEPKYLRMIHSFAGGEAQRVLVQAGKAARVGLTVAPPLFIYREPDQYTAEVESMLRP
jgi:tRNA1Val (adenine37-N6)-methyltransferase